MVALSRRLVYVGMFTLSMLRFKAIHFLDASDGIFALAAVLLIFSVHPPARAPKTQAWFIGAALVTLGGVLAAYDAVSAAGDIQVVFNGIFVLVLWQWSTRQLLDTNERIHTAMIAFIAGTALSGLVAFAQTEFHVLGYHAGHGAEASRAVGLSTQPNIAAVSYALALIFAIGLGLELGFRRKWILIPSLAFLAAALIFTASVSGLASTIVGLAFLFIKRGIKLRTLAGIVVVLALVYVVAISVQSHGTGFDLNPIARIEATTGQNTGYNTVQPRQATLDNAWAGIERDPIIGHGVDLASSEVYFDPDVGVYYGVHNLIVLLIYEGGILMLFGTLIIMVSAFRHLLARGRNPTRDMVCAGAIAVLVFSMQSPELFDRWLWLPFILAMCFRSSMNTTEPASLESAEAAEPARRRGTVTRAAGPAPAP
jgi:hypothetical protein